MKAFLRAIVLLSTIICINYASAVIIPDFQVNPIDTAFIAQYDNDIVFQPNGDFVVVWVDRGKESDNRQVYFQRFDSLANRLGSLVLVSDTSTGFYNQMCKIATDAVGNFAICYASIKTEPMWVEDIWVRLYDVNGLPLTSSVKVDVDRPDHPGNEVFSEWGPDIARHKSGKFVVGWAEEIIPSDTIPPHLYRRIYCQFFDANGQRIGNNIWVTEPDPDTVYKVDNNYVHVGVTDNGYVMLAWDSFVFKGALAYSLPMARIFSLDGVSKTSVFPFISPYDPVFAAAGSADINVTPNNEFVVACVACYAEIGTCDPPGGTIAVLRLDTLGNPLNQLKSVVDTNDMGDPYVDPRAAAGQGGYVVIWADQRNWPNWYDFKRDLMAQRFDYNDQPIGRNYRINGPPASLYWNYSFYNLDFSSVDKVGISWMDARNVATTSDDIYAKILDLTDIGVYMSGDLNQDGNANIADIIFLVNYIFKGGAQPYPLFTADVNVDCKVNLTDIVYFVNYVFKGGPAPQQGCA